MSYPPNSVLRIHCGDVHYTAVQLKNSRVLEVKPRGTTYDDLDAWKAARMTEGATLVADVSKAYGVVVPSDTKGFVLYSAARSGGPVTWTNWLFAVMAEGAPHLLDSEPVRDAFNALADALNKADDIIYGWYRFQCYSDWYYRPSNLHNPSSDAARFHGLPIHVNTYGRRDTEVARINAIGELYGALYALVKDDLTPFIVTKNKEMQKRAKIRACEKLVNFYTKRVKTREADLKWCKDLLERQKQKLAEIQSS